MRAVMLACFRRNQTPVRTHWLPEIIGTVSPVQAVVNLRRPMQGPHDLARIADRHGHPRP
jgi:hypothetical protein